MLDMQAIISRMAVILILLCVGFIARKMKALDEVSNEKVSRIIIQVALIGLILSSVMNVESGLSKAQALSSLGISFLLMLLCVGLGYLAPILLRVKAEEDRGVYIFVTAFGNIGFMGMPVVASLFGKDAVFLTALFNIPFNLFVFSIGLTMITDGQQRLRFSPRLFLSSPIIASLVALVIFLLDIPFPPFVAEAASTLGNFVLPSVMLVLGSSLAAIPLREIFADLRLYGQIILRLIIAPILTWGILQLLTKEPIIIGTLTVLAAMPAAAVATMLCTQYGGNERLATRSAVLSTFLSVLTIPLIVSLLLV
jgi:predicted permease